MPGAGSGEDALRDQMFSGVVAAQRPFDAIG